MGGARLISYIQKIILAVTEFCENSRSNDKLVNLEEIYIVCRAASKDWNRAVQ